MRARLLPNRNVVRKSHKAITETNEQYQQFLDENNDDDNIIHLTDLLNINFNKQGLNIFWDVEEKEEDAIDWYIHSAITYHSGEIVILLHPESIIGYWGPVSFMNVAMKTIEHESLHLQQKKKMGTKKWQTVKSGYQIGMQMFIKTQDRKQLMKIYLKDPQELQAHGHDLFREIELLGLNTLANLEYHTEQLPTYKKYRSIFDADDKTMKRLLKYTFEFFTHYR